MRYFNLNLEQQRQLVVWLSGVFGLLLGIISLFIIELRSGIESWFQLVLILFVVGIFVILCNAVVEWLFRKRQGTVGLGSRFWLSVAVGFLVLSVTAIGLAVLI